MDNYNRIRKTDTEQLLQGLPEFIIKDMVLYFLFDNYPKKSNYVTGALETFVNMLNLNHIKDVKIFDMIQWCKTAIEARKRGITSGYPFIDFCDTGIDKEIGYLQEDGKYGIAKYVEKIETFESMSNNEEKVNLILQKMIIMIF